ncbi:MAG: GTPase ObgE [Candidatus Omnitrophota bacterium]
MFIDTAKIYVKAGNGGKGCFSFYRDKLIREGRPDGGDGGDGGNVVIVADKNLFTLLDFQFNRHFSAPKGDNASSNNKTGKRGADLVIRVPIGTLVTDFRTNCFLRDLNEDKQELIVAKGGRGGIGNKKLKNRATDGQVGEEKELILDLKLIADVGIIGFPNAGKSTLISKISNAHPKIANYPFTTKAPILGVVQREDFEFIVTDIPGLIEGSHEGKGLGDKFLRHVERTKILVHLIDMSGLQGRDPIEDYRNINNELKFYNIELVKKPQIVVANKMDLEQSKKNLIRFKKEIKHKILAISALNSEGLGELIETIRKKL